MTLGEDNKTALPLEELALVPEWVRTPAKSFAHHTGQSREERRRPQQGRRPDRGTERPAQPPRHRPENRSRAARPSVPSRPAPAIPHELAPVLVSFLPEEAGFTAMLEAIRQSPRAYSLFDIAKLVLNKPERHVVCLAHKPASDGSRAPLFLVTADETPWLTQEEAIRHFLRRHLDKVCKETRTPIDPPKGNFTYVNRCGFTGALLGPPNYHEYQSRLVRHHQQRLSHVPFDTFKARIETVRDEAIVKAWLEAMSFKTEFECVSCAGMMFSSKSDIEKHFIEHHLAASITSSSEARISGPASRRIEHRGILNAVHGAWLVERRYPLRTAGQLSNRIRKEGFHFFKNHKGITFISHIRPRRLESLNGLTDQIQKIVAFIRANKNCHHKGLLAHFQVAANSPEEQRILADLHWLIQDGYVVEFSDGRLWILPEKPAKPTTATPPPEESLPEPIS